MSTGFKELIRFRKETEDNCFERTFFENDVEFIELIWEESEGSLKGNYFTPYYDELQSTFEWMLEHGYRITNMDDELMSHHLDSFDDGKLVDEILKFKGFSFDSKKDLLLKVLKGEIRLNDSKKL